MLARAACLALAFWIVVSPARAALDERTEQYLEGLRESGFADLAVDYLKGLLAKPGLAEADRADLEFELAGSLIGASESLADLSQRQQMLEEARGRFAEFTKKYPKHPKQSESLTQTATIDLQQGRLLVLQAQLPANAGQAVELAGQARDAFSRSAGDYEKARGLLFAEYHAMPVFIPDEKPADRALRQKKSKLFERYIEARFQAALARFYLADSYVSIEPPPPSDPKDAAAKAAWEKAKSLWAGEYKRNLEAARKGFEEIYSEHRRELVGLYAHLWMARCLAAQGESRRAMGIFEQLMEHENRDLAKFQREVFYFRTLLMAMQKDYQQIVQQGSAWLKSNRNSLREPAALGVQFEVARARVALGESAKQGNEKIAMLTEANRELDRLASFPNQYTGLARREQLRIAPLLAGKASARSFNQLSSLAGARLDALRSDLPAEERRKILSEVIALYQSAVAAAKPEDPVDAINDARLALAFAYLQADDVYSAGVLSEFIARRFPQSTAAPQAAYFAVTAYAWGYERSLELQDKGVAAAADVDAARVADLTAYLAKHWPNAKELDEARLTLARLEFSRKNYEAAAAALADVSPQSAKAGEAAALAGAAYWDLYRSQAKAENPDRAKLDAIRKNAIEKLNFASIALRKNAGDKFDRRLFVNDALLGEALFDAGDDARASATLDKLIVAVEKGGLPADVEPSLRIGALTTALQAAIRQAKLDQTDRLVELMSKQQGQNESGDVTLVFVSLAARLKEQINRLKASGDAAKERAVVDSFEKFLDRISQRDAGQTVQSLVYIADNFVELGKPAKAIELLTKARARSDADSEENKPTINRARLLLARAYKASGDYLKAREEIDSLLKENMGAKDVILERGDVLEAAGATEDAVKHWKWFIKRLTQTRPRPPEFYEAMNRLLNNLEKVSGGDRPERLREGLGYAKFLLNTDVSLPADLRPVFEQHVKKIEAEIGRTPQ